MICRDRSSFFVIYSLWQRRKFTLIQKQIADELIDYPNNGTQNETKQYSWYLQA